MKIIGKMNNYTNEAIINVEIIAAAVIGGGALLYGGKAVLNYVTK